MNTTISPDEKTTFTRISNNILAAQREIDELVVQLALGKAEARDKFEEIKSEFKDRITELEQLLESTSGKLVDAAMKAKIERLVMQLSLGKTESKELFGDQKTKITDALDAIEEDVRIRLQTIRVPDYFSHEIEKLKLKLEILRLRFGNKKFEAKDAFHIRMAAARREIQKMSSNVLAKMRPGKSRYSDFKEEISMAYDHIRKAVETL